MLSKRTLLEIQALLIEAGLDGLDPEIRSDDRRASPNGFEVEFHCYGPGFLDKLMLKSANNAIMFQWTLHDYTNYIKEDDLEAMLTFQPLKHFISMQRRNRSIA